MSGNDVITDPQKLVRMEMKNEVYGLDKIYSSA